MQKIAVIGAGAFGTALAQVAALAGRNVTVWSRHEKVVHHINTRKQNPEYLPGIALHDALWAKTDFVDALVGADLILLATPAQSTREILEKVAAWRRDLPAS